MNKVKKATTKIIASIIAAFMIFTVMPFNAMAYYMEKGEGVSFRDKYGNTLLTDSGWEAKFPYGTFAFSNSELKVTEGQEGKITVYRLGGTKGKAIAHLTYVPAVTEISKGVKSYSNAAGSDDIAIRVEDPLPIAEYQPLGKDPDPLKPSPAVGLKVGEADVKGDIHIKIGVDADAYQWYILKDEEWKKVEGATGKEFVISQNDYDNFDVRCIYILKGTSYCSDSAKGKAYEYPQQEVINTPPADIELNPSITYSNLPMNDEDKYAGYTFDLTFAENEWVKDIYVESKNNDKAEPDKFGMFTIVGCEGGSLYDAANTLMFHISDDEAPTASQIGFAVTEVTADKSTGTARLTVKRTGGKQNVLSVDYSTKDGTAKAGKDYSEVKGTLNFYSDVDEQTIEIPLINDGKATNDKSSLTVSISNLKGDKDKICTLTETVATVYLYNTAAEGKKNLATMLYDAEGSDISEKVSEAQKPIARTQLGTVGGTEIKGQSTSGHASIIYPDKNGNNGEINLFTYEYPLGKVKFTNPVNAWQDRTLIANKNNWYSGDTLSGLYKNGWTKGIADGNGWKVESKGKESGELTIPYGSAMYSSFYGTFSWNASLASDGDLFLYGLEYVYPYFEILKSNGQQFAYANASHSTSGSWIKGYTLTWYTSGSLSKSWDFSDNIGKLRLGTAIYDAHNGKSNAVAALTNAYLTRRAFTKDLGLRIFTANDSDSSPSGCAKLTLESGVYDSIQPSVSIINGQGGVNGYGKLYVGSNIQVELKETPAYKPATEDSNLNYAVYLTNSKGDIVATGTKEANSNKYNIKMVWNGISQTSITDTYTINVVMTRKQKINVDLRPSVQRLKDSNGNVLGSIDPTKINEAFNEFESSGTQSYITVGYSETDKTSSTLFTYKTKNISKSDLKSSNTEGVFTYTPDLENVQWINFNMPAEDIILLNGKSYYGNEKIYLGMENLATATLDFRYYDKNYITAKNNMTTSIAQTALYLDANGNGRIDGYFNKETGYFILDKDNNGNEIDQFILFLDPDTDYDESIFAPIPLFDSNGQIVGYRQYFFKTFYTMTPRCLTVPAGANEDDFAQVIPAFIADITDPASASALTKEQKSYRYIVSGMSRSYANNSVSQSESDYKPSSDNHLMYGSEASMVQMIDIPLGGDHNPPKLVNGSFTWSPEYHGNLIYDFENPSPVFIPHSLAGDNIPVAEITSIDTDTGTVTYKDGDAAAAAKINNYLGSFTGNDTFALGVQEQQEITVKSSSLPVPETISHSTSGVFPNSDYLKVQNGASSPNTDVDMSKSGSEFPEFNFDMGTKLPVAEISVTDYVTITMDGYEVGFSIGIPIGGYESNGDDSTGGSSESNWFGPKKANATKMEEMGLLKDFIKKPSMDTAKAADDSYKNAKDKGKMKSSSFSVDFSVSLAFLFKYNPIDNAFYFNQFSVAVAAELEYKYQYRLTPCPIVYLYVTVGISLEIGTGLTVDRDPKEEPDAVLKTEKILKPGESYTFETDYKAFNVVFNGKLGLKSTVPDFKEGFIKSEGSEPVTVTMVQQDDNKLSNKCSVTLVAIEETTIKRVARVVDANSNVYWNGMTISPEAFVEAGAGIGIEIMKFEVFIKISVGCSMTLGAYEKKYDVNTGLYKGDYKGFSFDSFEFSMGIGFRVVLLFFSYEMDLVKYSITYEKDEGWKHSWSALGDMFGGDIGTLSMTDSNGKTMNSSVRISLPASTQKSQKIYQPERDGELSTYSYNPSDKDVPFQLSGYGSSGDAFKLVDGLLTGYDYQVVTVGKDNYVIYTYGRKNATNEVDNSMLVMSKLRVTSANGKESYGLVNPVNELSSTPYILVDTLDGTTDDGTGDLGFKAWSEGNKIHAAWISYAEKSSAVPAVLDKPKSQVPELSDGTDMDLTNYKNTGFKPTAPVVVENPGTKPVQPVQEDYYISESEYSPSYESYVDAKSAYDAAIAEYNEYDGKKQAYDNYLTAKNVYDAALKVYNDWYYYYTSIDDYNTYIQSRAAKAAKNTVIRKASFEVKTSYDETEGFTAAQTISGPKGATVYVPDASGDGSVVFYAKSILDDSWKANQVADYTAYLNTAYPGDDASKSIREYRLLYQTGLWETYGKGTKLCVNVNGVITEIALASGQVLDNIETKKMKNGEYCIVYTTSEQDYQSEDFVTTRRLYMRSAKVKTDNTVEFKPPYLIRTLVDYDRNLGGKDGVYTKTSLSKAYSDPYFANLQFLNGKLGQLIEGESISQLSDTTEEFLLFEMNGSTYIITEEQIASVLTSGTGTLYPFFTPENMTDADGEPQQQTTTGRSEVTIGADGAGNISAVYTAAVANTGNNALYLSKYDPNTNTWGVGIMLAMHNMQVYEDGISKGWTKEEYEKAYLGQLGGYSGGSMDTLKFSNIQIALGLTAEDVSAESLSVFSMDGTSSQSTSSRYEEMVQKFGDLKENSELSLLSSDDANELAAFDVPTATKDTLLVLTQASFTKLKEVEINGEKVLGPDGTSTVGVYAISYGIGGQSIGEDSVRFPIYNFTAGSVLKPVVNFTNNGDVSIRGSEANPITIKLNIKTPDGESSVLNSWQIKQNIVSGQKVELSGSCEPLTTDLPAGSVFYITVEEDKTYTSNAFNATTLSSDGKSGTLVVEEKPELGFESFSIKNESIDSNGNAVLKVEFQVGNRGSKAANNAYVQFSYEAGMDINDKLTYKTVDLTLPGTDLSVSKEQTLSLLAASTDTDMKNGILYLYNSEDGGNISVGKGRTVSGTLVVPSDYYKGNATGSLNLNVEIFSDADNVISSIEGVINAEHGEYNSVNNVATEQIEHASFFKVADRLTLAMGNTMHLPVSIDTTKDVAPVVLAEEISDADDGNANLGILYYKENENFSNGHSTGMLVITPAREGTGVIHIKDIGTNTTRAITYTVTGFGEGINIYNDNNIFSFKNADGKPYKKDSTDPQSWSFKDNIPTWGLNQAESVPYLANLSYGDNNASFSFNSVAESIDLYFNGEVTVESTFPGFSPVSLSASGGKSSASVRFGDNPTNYAHTVTVTIKSENAQFDKLVEHYAFDRVPVPAKDKNSPQIFWNRSFPQTASINSGSDTVNLTCYVVDESGLSSVTVNDSVPSGIAKNDSSFWQFSLPVNENGVFTVAATDSSGNRTVQRVIVDWFNSTISSGAIADAPSLTAKFQIGSQDMLESQYVKEGETAYIKVLAEPGKDSKSDISTIIVKAITKKATESNETTLEIDNLTEEDDGRFIISNNGYYLVNATAEDGTWRTAILFMNRMDTAKPFVQINDNGEGSSMRSLSWSVSKGDEGLSTIKTATINDFPLDFQQGLTRIAGTLPISFGGKYTLYAEDEVGNANTGSINISSLKIDVSDNNVFEIRNSWNKDKNNGSITINTSNIKGGIYDDSKSQPSKNIYHGSYEYAVVSSNKDLLFDESTATPEEKTQYTQWIDDLNWQDNSIISDLAPGNYTIYVRDAQDKANVDIIAKKQLSVGDDFITFKAVSTSTSGYVSDNGSIKVTAAGGKGGSGLYQFALLKINDSKKPLTACADIADKGGVWQIADVPLNAMNIKTFDQLKQGDYQIAVRSMEGVTTEEIDGLRLLYDAVVSGETRVKDAKEAKSSTRLNEVANTYIISIDTALQNWSEATNDKEAKEVAYKAAIDNNANILDKLQLWIDAKTAVDHGSGTQETVNKTKDDYNQAVKAFALTKAVQASDNELAAANDALALSKQAYSDAEMKLNEKVDAAYTADPSLWDGAATAKQKVDYIRDSITYSEDEKEATPDATVTPNATTTLSPTVTPAPAIQYDNNTSEGKIIVTIPEGITTIDDETAARIISDNASKGIVIKGKGLLVQIPKGILNNGSDLESIILLNQQIPADPKAYAVAYTGKDGKTIVLPWSSVTSDKIAYIALAPGKYSLVKNETLFKDVPSDFWGADAISFASSRNLFKGIDESTFAPEAPMTRAMFVTVLGRLEGIDVKNYTSSQFNDVLPDEWYSPYVKWASDNGIVNGYSDRTFGPDDLITREQLCAIFSRFMKYKGITVEGKAASPKFDDSNKISPWSREAVDFCRQAGLIQGKGNNLFDPLGISNRAEGATTFMNLINIMLKNIDEK